MLRHFIVFPHNLLQDISGLSCIVQLFLGDPLACKKKPLAIFNSSSFQRAVSVYSG